MRLLSKLDDIALYAGVNKHKVKELMLDGIIPTIINKSTNRAFFYTTDTLIDYSSKKISRKLGINDKSNRDIFLKENLDECLAERKGECKVYSITNQKGGVAKTTISVNLASTLAFLNQKVLLIDLDSQAQASRYLNKDQYTNKSLVNILNEYLHSGKISKEIVEQYITKHFVVNEKTIDILPSELRLSKVLELCRTSSMPHTILAKIIETIKDKYDFIIIDLPPSSGISIEMALFASDNIILATNCDEFSKEGIEVTLEGINVFNKNIDKSLVVDSCFISMYNKNANIHNSIKEELIDILTLNSIEEKKIFINPYNLIIPESQHVSSALIGFFQKEVYSSKTDSVNYVSTITQSLLANEQFFDYAIQMINNKEEL